jgi:hypothetical protein
MNPRVWGRSVWTSLIYIAQGFPDDPTEEDKKIYFNFFNNIGNVLPCHSCKINYSKHISDLPPDVSSRTNLLAWFHQLHNKTLQQMNRKTISYEGFLKKYVGGDNAQSFNYANISIGLLVLLAVVAGIYFVLYKKGSSSASLK